MQKLCPQVTALASREEEHEVKLVLRIELSIVAWI